MSRITGPEDKADPFNRDDSLELDRLDRQQAAANRYQIDPLSDSSDNEDDEDILDENHTLTGKKEALLKKQHHHHSDNHDPATSSSSSDDSNQHQSAYNPRDDNDSDTIDVHIIPLSTSEAIDRERGDLQKNVTFSNGLTLVVGVIIGSGIFASPGPVFAYSKSVGVSLIIWFVSGLLAFAGSLCYAELGSAMPSSGGGEHAYLNHAFGSLPAFLFSWTSIALLKVRFCVFFCLFGCLFVEVFFLQKRGARRTHEKEPQSVVTKAEIHDLTLSSFFCFSPFENTKKKLV